MHKKYIAIILVLNALIFRILAGEPLRIARVFSNNMVLQRGINAPVWGSGIADEKVTIEIGAKKSTTKVLVSGKWMVRLPKLKVGGPYTFKVYCQHDTITFGNVLVGDVWLASGQSNMAMSLSWGVNNKDEEIRNANNANIRFLSIDNDLDNKPLNDISGGEWSVCTPESVKDFSAIGYFFARQISNELKVPIGIINSSWGGTDIQAWMSREALETIPFYHDSMPKIDLQTADFSNGYEQFLATNKLRDSIIDRSNVGFEKKVFAPEFDDSNWKTMNIPCKWSTYGISNYFGYVWFRKHILLKENDKELVLHLGEVSNENSAFFNGIELIKLGTGTNVTYTIPSELLKMGDNLISILVLGRWGVGGFNSPAEFIYLASADESTNISLANTWKYNEKIEPQTPEWHEYYNYPTFIYNAKIAPIIPFGLKGILWYQGENNTKKPEKYFNYFSLLIKDWRTRWKQGNLPVIYGQLSNYKMRLEQPEESKIALLREEQTKGMTLKNTAMVANIDLGLADGEVHFKNKQTSARRFANAALGLVYGKNCAYRSPIFNSFTINQNKITLHFLNTFGFLTSTEDQPLKGFAIAGEEKKFVWAEARIAGNKVAVWNNAIKNPKYVRYGWADNPDCNLLNGAGLPLIPFRTDQ